MGRRLRQWWKLPFRERAAVAALMVVQPAISLALHTVGYHRTLRWLERRSEHRYPRTATVAELAFAQRTAQLAAIAGRHGPVTTTCLRQALAIYWLLRRRGLQPSLKLGVARINTTPDMHAWVELNGTRLAQPAMHHAAFLASTASRQPDTAATTSGKRA